MKVEGQCRCGQIRFEAEIDLDTVGICHRTDWQTLTGSAYRVSPVPWYRRKAYRGGITRLRFRCEPTTQIILAVMLASTHR